ncbi:MAG: hypothetical protein OXB93_04360 [Cytophagales bacterium]|nr:hypothetical protein [Cytophagales bacterium]
MVHFDSTEIGGVNVKPAGQYQGITFTGDGRTVRITRKTLNLMEEEKIYSRYSSNAEGGRVGYADNYRDLRRGNFNVKVTEEERHFLELLHRYTDEKKYLIDFLEKNPDSPEVKAFLHVLANNRTKHKTLHRGLRTTQADSGLTRSELLRGLQKELRESKKPGNKPKIFDLGNQDTFIPTKKNVETRFQSSSHFNGTAERFAEGKQIQSDYGVVVEIQNDKGVIGMSVDRFGEHGVESEVMIGDHIRYELTCARVNADKQIVIEVKQLEN